jgi:hypothetical protein
VIDLGEIERINSCGVRDWVNWLSKLENNGTRSVLVECSPAIVAQINLVNNFTGNGVVKSFYVPYFCPECDEEKVLLVEAADMGPPPHEPPTCRCDECDLVMDFDDMPDSYFAFLSNQRKLVEPDKINGAMRDLGRGSEPDAPSNGPRNKVRSRASQPAIGAKPSVPSLPSLQRGGGPTPAQASNGRPYATTPPSRPQLGTKPPTGPGNPGSRPPMGPGMSPAGYPVAPMANPRNGGHPGPMPGQMPGAMPGQMSGYPAAHPGAPMNGQLAGPAPMNGHGHMPGAVQRISGQVGNSGPMPLHPSQNHLAHSGPMSIHSGGGAGNHAFGNFGPGVAAPSKSNTVVFVLIAILVVAIAVLAYLVVTK